MAREPGGQQRLERARRALYRPGAGEDDRRRYAALAGSRGRSVRAAVAVGAVVLLAVGGAGMLGASRGSERGAASAPGAGPRSTLPVGWEGARTALERDDLDGARTLRVSATAEPMALLLVVRCPAADRSFQVEVTDAGRRVQPLYGTCGAPIALPLGDSTGPLEILVTTRGVLPFAASVLRR